jgi:hypothetical protein
MQPRQWKVLIVKSQLHETAHAEKHAVAETKRLALMKIQHVMLSTSFPHSLCVKILF